MRLPTGNSLDLKSRRVKEESLFLSLTLPLKDGERTYSVNVQRKNSLFFGSTKGALNSAVYNTFIETCKQVGVSFRDYFRVVLKELGSGRKDYENLLPMTIGIKRNN